MRNEGKIIMIEVSVHIFTDGDFKLLQSPSLDFDGSEVYSAKKFFETKDEAENYIDVVFNLINTAYNPYGQHKNLIERLKGLRKNVNYADEYMFDADRYKYTSVYLANNQEFEIDIIEHALTKKEFLEQRIYDISEEYFELYGTYPKIIGKAK